MRKSFISRVLAAVIVSAMVSAGTVSAQETEDPGSSPVQVSTVKGSFSVDSVNGNKGTFRIKGSGVSASSGVKSVEYNVWRDANKNDSRKYRADSSYAAVVNVANHKYHFGTYTVEMSVTSTDGSTAVTSTGKVTITALNYIYAVKANQAGTQWRITILNAKIGSKWAKSVRMNTWSATKGKTDLIKYKAKQISTHNWAVTMNSKKHIFDGLYYTQARGNGKSLLGTVSYRAARPLSAVEKMAEARLKKSGRSLRSAFRWSIMRYRAVTHKWRRKPDTLATYGLRTHRGDCSVMAATFYHLARRLGYDAHYVRGYCRSGGGGLTPHAWVEIKQKGKIRVYDPDLQSESGRNGYHLTYRSGGTWGYYRHKRIN